LIANEADVIGIGGTSTILANLKGADTVIIGSIENILGFQLITLPSISKPADLIGKPLGISTFGSTSDFALREMVRRAGIDPEKITIVPVGDLATRLGAVQSGRIVGSIFIPPSSSVATKAGLKVLLDSSKLGIPFQGSGITTLRRTIERSPEKLRRFMKAYIEGLYLFKTNKTLALRMVSRVTRQQDPEALEVAYDYYVNLYPQVPYPTKEGIRTSWLRQRLRHGTRLLNRSPMYALFKSLSGTGLLRISIQSKDVELPDKRGDGIIDPGIQAGNHH
jgi:ABC-type nitrate/sulfonate/bicarbonate transport system substrate-binding protein